MSSGPRHYAHIVRVLGLFAGGFTLFLIVRYFLVPSDFGVFGFYRAGALADARARAPMYAATNVCLDCHPDIAKEREGSKHAAVNCQACHGPLAQHATGDVKAKPAALNPRLSCLTCHTSQAGLPRAFPSVVAKDHAGDAVCTDCHRPHLPKIG